MRPRPNPTLPTLVRLTLRLDGTMTLESGNSREVTFSGLVLTDMGDGHETGEAVLDADALPPGAPLPTNSMPHSLPSALTSGLTAGPMAHKRIGAGMITAAPPSCPGSLFTGRCAVSIAAPCESVTLTLRSQACSFKLRSEV